MLYFISDGYARTAKTPDISDRCFGWWLLDFVDTTPKEVKGVATKCIEMDSGVSSGHASTSPFASILEIPNITIESPLEIIDGNLTPEGNVKYKNYRILAPANVPIRMYSPSGDIHTTPSKNKIVPKFTTDVEITHNKISALLEADQTQSVHLEQIINPDTPNRRRLDNVRLCNSKLEACHSNSDVSKSDRSTPYQSRASTAMDVWTLPADLNQCDQPMSLHDELLLAAKYISHENRHIPPPYFNSLSSECDPPEQSRLTPNSEYFLRNFYKSDSCRHKDIYQLICDVSRLEDDMERLNDRIARTHQQVLIDDFHTCHVTRQVKHLSTDLKNMRYLDDVIYMLKGELERLQPRNWPFKIAHTEPIEDDNFII